MKRQLPIFAGCFAALSFVACSLLVDTAGLGGGANDVDARADAEGVDGRITDDSSAPPADARTDAPGTGTKCVDSPTRFCDDFDSPTPGSKWTSTSKTRGEITFEDVGVSLPRAMHAALQAGNGAGVAKLVNVRPGNLASIRCELDMKLDGILALGETDVLSFVSESSGGERDIVYLASISGSWSLAEFATGSDGGVTVDRAIKLGVPLPNATWFHVIAEVTPTAATLTANGTTITLDALTMPAGTQYKIQVGLSYASEDVQSGGIYIDNVDCTTLP